VVVDMAAGAEPDKGHKVAWRRGLTSLMPTVALHLVGEAQAPVVDRVPLQDKGPAVGRARLGRTGRAAHLGVRIGLVKAKVRGKAGSHNKQTSTIKNLGLGLLEQAPLEYQKRDGSGKPPRF